jgi:hypothetical protein
MGLVVEVIAAVVCPRRPAVVVDCERIHSRIAESKSQLLIERMEPPDVGEDHRARCVNDVGRRTEGDEPISIACFEDEPSSPPCAASHGAQWGSGGGLMAHAHLLLNLGTEGGLIGSNMTGGIMPLVSAHRRDLAVRQLAFQEGRAWGCALLEPSLDMIGQASGHP